jgi:hypothetical protein
MRHDSCAVVQESRDMCESHVVGLITWVSRKTHFMFLISCTTIV